MSNSIFTLVYSKDHQTRFERAIKERRLDAAQEELKKLPPSKDVLSEMHRIVIIAQGYKALAESRKELFNNILTDYRTLGTVQQIRVNQELLKEYRSLGPIESIRAKLAKISEFESSAKKTY